ncbi:MAG: membrane protein insertion efficiency factor YidD [Acidobacteriota bacterium]
MKVEAEQAELGEHQELTAEEPELSRFANRQRRWAAQASLRMAKAALWMLKAYKRWISPLLPRACRFTPTCSEYAALAIRERGLLMGGWLSVARIWRCQPWYAGGVDLPRCCNELTHRGGR